MNKTVTTILFVIASILYFLVGRYQSAAVCSISKVLPLLILSGSLLLTLRNDHSSTKTIWLSLAALFFSMLGDVFGEFKGGGLIKNAFVLQIASFAVAQIIYTISFIRFFRIDASFGRNLIKWGLCIILIVYMVCFGMFVLSFVVDSSLRIAVPVYVVLIGMMGLSSVLQYRNSHWFFIVGAFLFISSDSVLAYRSFVGPVSQAGLIIMSTYYAAQLLLNITLLKKNESH